MAPIKKKAKTLETAAVIGHGLEEELNDIPCNQEALPSTPGNGNEILPEDDLHILSEDEEVEAAVTTIEEQPKLKKLKFRKASSEEEDSPNTSKHFLEKMAKKRKAHQEQQESSIKEKKAKTSIAKFVVDLKTMDPLKLIETQKPKIINGVEKVTMLMILSILWDDLSTWQICVPNLQQMVKTALKQKKYELKRHISMMSQIISSTLKNLQPVYRESGQCSIVDFVKSLQKGESFTTFMEFSISAMDLDWIIDQYDLDLVVPSSSYANMTTTSTLSMTAPTATAAVDVDLSTSCETPKESPDDILGGLFPLGNSESNIGGISQSIAKREGDTLYTLTSPGESGMQVCKMDLYNYSTTVGVAKQDWWKKALYRTTFIISSPADPKQALAKRLLSQAGQQIQKIPGMKKEAKVMRSFGGFKSDQQHR